MPLEGSATGKQNAKRLRREMTPPEIALWLALHGTRLACAFADSTPFAIIFSISTAPPRVSLSRSMARHTPVAIDRRETPSATHGSQRKD